MIPDSDHPFDRAAAGLPTRELSDRARDQHRRMIAELAARPAARPPWYRRRWVLMLAAIVGLSGAGLGTAAALGLFSAPPTDRRIAYCFTTTDLGDPSNRVAVAVATPPDGGLPSLGDAATGALDICSGGWLQGRLSATDPKVLLDPKPPPWNYPIPPLVVCVLPSGEVGVFPGSAATCERLGLPLAEF